MKKGFRSRPTSAPIKPADAAGAAPLVRKFILKLFDREDGKAADWPLIAETLLQEAFYALDQLPDDPRTLSLLRRAEGGLYNRLAGNAPDHDPAGRAEMPSDDLAPGAVRLGYDHSPRGD